LGHVVPIAYLPDRKLRPNRPSCLPYRRHRNRKCGGHILHELGEPSFELYAKRSRRIRTFAITSRPDSVSQPSYTVIESAISCCKNV